jgi:hypothetical protein
MYSTHVGQIDIPNLPEAARTVHIVPDLTSHSLLSIGQLCDAGCIVEFTATKIVVKHKKIIILQGQRTPSTQLWHIDLPAPKIQATRPNVQTSKHPNVQTSKRPNVK